MRVLLVTDSFPPVCGGSGWSTFELARGLRALGHDVHVVRPRPGSSGEARADYEDIPVHEIGAAAPNIPYVRNYLKSERLARVVAPTIERLIVQKQIDIVHGQHVMSALPSAAAAARTGKPFACTVRDYWPVCYWSTLLVKAEGDILCPACTARNMRRCTTARAGAAWPFAMPMLSYMRRNLHRKAATLRQADAVVAVSSTISQDLATRCEGLDVTRLHTIPNPVDVAGLLATAASSTPPVPTPYALYVGKLAANKGVTKLFDAAERAGLSLPLVIVGDGPLRADVERRAASSGIQSTFTGWLPRSDTLTWMRHASFLVFPSQGPESLSRVLLESSALGVPAAAMLTGGTADIVVGGVTGLLSTTTDGLARDVARLERAPDERRRLGEAAARHVRDHFDAPQVVRRIVSLYEHVMASPRRATQRGTGGVRG